MVYGVIKYYKLYLLLLPYFIFWFSYVSYLILFLYCVIYVRSYTLYFPEETEWPLINFLWVLPMRIVFNSIYFINTFSFRSLALVLYSVSILLIVGLPFVFIRILLAYIRIGDICGVWDDISPYTNIKLLIRDGKITRNMKKIIEGGRIYKDVLHKAGPIDKGLLKTDKGGYEVSHAVSHVEKIGVMYTTKKQKDSEALITNVDNTFVYAQSFGDNKIINECEIKNSNLHNLLYKRGSMDAICAHLQIVNMRKIILNDRNRQMVINLERNQINASKDFIIKCGGIVKVKEAFDYNDSYNKITNDAQKMLFELNNTNSSSIPEKFIKNKEIYDILVKLEKEGQLEGELLKIKNNIDKIIDLF